MKKQNNQSKIFGDVYGIFDSSKENNTIAKKALEKIKKQYANQERQIFLRNDLVINNF